VGPFCRQVVLDISNGSVRGPITKPATWRLGIVEGSGPLQARELRFAEERRRDIALTSKDAEDGGDANPPLCQSCVRIPRHSMDVGRLARQHGGMRRQRLAGKDGPGRQRVASFGRQPAERRRFLQRNSIRPQAIDGDQHDVFGETRKAWRRCS